MHTNKCSADPTKDVSGRWAMMRFKPQEHWPMSHSPSIMIRPQISPMMTVPCGNGPGKEMGLNQNHNSVSFSLLRYGIQYS